MPIQIVRTSERRKENKCVKERVALILEKSKRRIHAKVNGTIVLHTLTFTRLDDAEQLGFRNRTHFRQWHIPLSSFLLALLLNHVAEHFRALSVLSVFKIRWNGARLFCVRSRFFSCFLLMHFDSEQREKYKTVLCRYVSHICICA